MKNTRCLNKAHIAGVIGIAACAWAMFNIDDYSWQLDILGDKIRQAKRETDPTQKQQDIIESQVALRGYLVNFVPDETLVNAVCLGTIIRLIGEWDE